LSGLSNRQIDILHVVLEANRIHVRGIVDKLGSPNRLAGDLVELVQKRFLHMEREGQQHYYELTKTGLNWLGEHEAKTAATAIANLTQLAERIPEVAKNLPIESDAPRFFSNWKMVRLSDMLGRSLCQLEVAMKKEIMPTMLSPNKPNEEVMYAYALLSNDGKKAEITLISRDRRKRITYGLSMAGVVKYPPMTMISSSLPLTVAMPNDIPESDKKEILEEFRKLEQAAAEVQEKAAPLVDRGLSFFAEEQRQEVLERMSREHP